MVIKSSAVASTQMKLFLKVITTARPATIPVSVPYRAKARPGIHGSKMGAATAPPRIPAA